MSPLFFNIYSEANFGEAIAEGDEIKTVNRLRISDMLTTDSLDEWINHVGDMDLLWIWREKVCAYHKTTKFACTEPLIILQLKEYCIINIWAQ